MNNNNKKILTFNLLFLAICNLGYSAELSETNLKVEGMSNVQTVVGRTPDGKLLINSELDFQKLYNQRLQYLEEKEKSLNQYENNLNNFKAVLQEESKKLDEKVKEISKKDEILNNKELNLNEYESQLADREMELLLKLEREAASIEKREIKPVIKPVVVKKDFTKLNMTEVKPVVKVVTTKKVVKKHLRKKHRRVVPNVVKDSNAGISNTQGSNNTINSVNIGK